MKYWTLEICIKESLKYKTRNEWKLKHPNSYSASLRNGWSNECCRHMVSRYKPKGYWTFERCKAEALKYSTRKEWEIQNISSYSVSRRKDWHDECCAHMTEILKPKGYWTLEMCKREATKYRTRHVWKTRHSSSYSTAFRNKWFDACCTHMVEGKRPNGYWTLEMCQAEALKYRTRQEWATQNESSYQIAMSKKWLEPCCGHMTGKMYVNQEKVRHTFERIYHLSFKSVKPKFLKGLSLDGYNNAVFIGKRIKLAFEYDGEFHDKAHYKSKNPEKDLRDSKHRDSEKNRLCLENNVILIRIHYSNKKNIEETIINELKTKNLLPKTYNLTSFEPL